MTEQAQPDYQAIAASFVEHVRSFHRTLPTEEQVLLEQVFALAEMAKAQAADTSGFALNAYLALEGTKQGKFKGEATQSTRADKWISSFVLPPNPFA